MSLESPVNTRREKPCHNAGQNLNKRPADDERGAHPMFVEDARYDEGKRSCRFVGFVAPLSTYACGDPDDAEWEAGIYTRSASWEGQGSSTPVCFACGVCWSLFYYSFSPSLSHHTSCRLRVAHRSPLVVRGVAPPPPPSYTMESHAAERESQADLNGARDGGVHTPLVPPDTPRFGEGSPSLQESARTSFLVPATPDASRPFLAGGTSEEKFVGGGEARASGRRRRWLLFALVGAVAVVVIVLAVALPVTLVHKHSSSTGSGGSGGASAASPTSNPESPTGAVSGGNGTVIKTENGQTFTYINNFGGICECVALCSVSNTDVFCRGRRPGQPIQQQCPRSVIHSVIGGGVGVGAGPYSWYVSSNLVAGARRSLCRQV